jgi:hypothetical protein
MSKQHCFNCLRPRYRALHKGVHTKRAMISLWTRNNSMTGAITRGETLTWCGKCDLTHTRYNPRAFRSNNYHTKVKTGPSKNRKTHFVTTSGEINQLPICTMCGDTNTLVIKPHKNPHTRYNNVKMRR